MRTICLMCAALLVLAGSSFAAGKGDMNGPYEHQLQKYSFFYGDLMDKKAKKDKAEDARNEKLRVTEMMLESEYKDLQSGIENKEENIGRLKKLTVKMQKTQKQMYAQYSELEGRFEKQKEENTRLKDELQTNKVDFYQKMVNFYQEEYGLLGDKLSEVQQRKDAVGEKLKQMKQGLDQMKKAGTEKEEKGKK